MALPDAVHDVLDLRTNPTWPTTWFVPNTGGDGAFSDVYNVMYHWGANHGVIGYGHFGHDLLTLASMLRIPVYMHNVGARPHLPPQRLERLRHGRPGGRGLSGVRELRGAVRAVLGDWVIG